MLPFLSKELTHSDSTFRHRSAIIRTGGSKTISNGPETGSFDGCHKGLLVGTTNGRILYFGKSIYIDMYLFVNIQCVSMIFNILHEGSSEVSTRQRKHFGNENLPPPSTSNLRMSGAKYFASR